MRTRWVVAAVVALGLIALLAPTGWAGEKKEKDEKVTIDQVPEAVRKTILKEANGAKITEIEKETENGKTVYEAEFVADGKEIEIKVAADGKLLSRKAEEEDDDEKEGKDDDEDDDEKNEQKVTLDQVPAPVKETILKEAKGAKITEIEKETTKDGKTVYEAEFVVEGKEIEIKVAPDGKLLSRKAADEDDDKDDDDKDEK